MKNLTVKQRLFTLISAAAVLLVVFGAAAITGMGSTVHSLNQVYVQRVVPLKELKTIADDYAVLVVDTAHKVRNANISWEQGLSNLDDATRRTSQMWSEYKQRNLHQRERELVASVDPLIAKADTEIARLREILNYRDMDALTAFTIDTLYPTIDPVSDGISSLVAVQLDISKEVYDAADASYSFTRNLFIILLVIAIALLVFVAQRFTGAILSSLNDAVDHCERLAGGDLTSKLTVTQNDEIGHLIHALNNMAERLQGIVGDVNTAAFAINTGAREIASGNLHLSQRTEQQAANLEETASSMEEMTATVRHNADNSLNANKLAREAREEAERGAQVVAGARDAMERINESSQKITDITSVVDEIAFQTNLLALNAAVEAARAGDAGRGFAVVAAEVRVLAQRSAAAAKQIKDLIEESTVKVAHGSKLVSESEETLKGIVESIKRVSVIASEISSSSEEQSEGIAQVNIAVTQMDQATQQNAALVEEAAAAAKNLEEQAVALEHLMSYFQLDNSHAFGSLPPSKPAPALSHRPSAAPQISKPSASTSSFQRQPEKTYAAAGRPQIKAPKRANESLADPSSNWEEF